MPEKYVNVLIGISKKEIKPNLKKYNPDDWEIPPQIWFEDNWNDPLALDDLDLATYETYGAATLALFDIPDEAIIRKAVSCPVHYFEERIH